MTVSPSSPRSSRSTRTSLGPWAEAARQDAPTRPTLADDPDLRAEIQAAVDEANGAVSRAESIRKFVVLPHDWTEEGGQLTPSLKLKRNVVMREERDEIGGAVPRLSRPGSPRPDSGQVSLKRL